MGYFSDLAKQVEEFDRFPMRYALSRITHNADGTMSLNLPKRWIVDAEAKKEGACG